MDPEFEEPAEMTLDEYREMERKNRVQAEFKIRRAGEGVDDDQWKKTYELKKTPQVEEDEEEYDEEVSCCIVTYSAFFLC